MTETPKLVAIPFVNLKRTEANVQVNGSVFPVVAKGRAAEALNAIGAKAELEIEGNLILQEWTTADHKKHSRIEIHAKVVRSGQEAGV